ncbi:hypothetical protein [Streptomyces sp. NBC_00878]|uniref:hypothetical protein n=1 Tax=Streptomyces sp. NBC_00878 TaxID=2975854 RepID=UPI0022598E9B|nr:hypothetical protein [Streptomyces sp. NBC_00878]MCX4904041.1 hypothetical protein [Streptomyces sp. NBC_00878]
MVAVAALLCLLILADALYDTARLLTPAENRRPPRRRLRDRRTALEAAERRLVEQRLHGRIDPATYQARMCFLADGRRAPRARRHD